MAVIPGAADAQARDTSTVHYAKPERIAFLPAGDKPGHAAIFAGREEELAHGPQAFDVAPDGARLAVADSIAGKVLLLDARGAIQAELRDPALRGAEDLLFDAGVSGVAPGLTAAIPAREEFRRLTPLAPGATGLRLSTAMKNPAPAAVRVQKFGFSGIRTDGAYQGAQGHVSGDTAGIDLYGAEGGKPAARIPLQPPAPGRIGAVKMLGADQAGNLYAKIEVLLQDAPTVQVRRFVVRADPRALKPAAAVEIPMDVLAFPARDLRVDDAGTIYALLVRKEGTTILAWRPQ